METQRSSCRRPLSALLAALIVAACGGTVASGAVASQPAPAGASAGTTPGATAVTAPASSVPTATGPASAQPGASSSQPAASSSQSAAPSSPVAEASPPVASACPAPGSTLTVDRLLALGTACFGISYRTAGWLDQLRGEDTLPVGTFVEVLRGALPSYSATEGMAYAPALYLDQADVVLPYDALTGRWVEATLSMEADATRNHCLWAFSDPGDQRLESPPLWTCPAYGLVEAMQAATPPATALANCPATGAPIPVASFGRFPRACFGSRSVSVSGWLDTWYVIGGWESPWTIRPGWLWSFAIGNVPMLSPTSNPSDRDAIRLHLRPGSAPASAAQNRWVVVTGHYATAAEAATCEVVTVAGGPAGDQPSNLEAKRDCAAAFIVTAVRPGEPG